MSYQKIIINETHLQFAYTRVDRNHIKILSDMANELFNLIEEKKADKKQIKEYYALKFAVKQLVDVDKT